MKRAVFGLLLLLGAGGAPVHAQSAPPAQTARPVPPLRRWLDVQTFTLSARYRFIENSADVVTSDHMQYREIFRARVTFDARRRYSLNVGTGSGNSFISGWSNTGVGTGARDLHDNYVKHLFFDANPVSWLDLQFGGMYVTRGESTEFTTYDDDGYVTAGRVSVRRPRDLYFDEITVTRGFIGPYPNPNVNKRWEQLDTPNYFQGLVAKRFTRAVSASADYTTHAGEDTVHAAIALRLPATAPLSALRYEQYGRVTGRRGAGFALTADRALPHAIRLQGGFATIDRFHNSWNSDRMQRGRRLFGILNVPVAGPLSSQFFITHAFHSNYPLTIGTRFDAVLTYDVGMALRNAGVF